MFTKYNTDGFGDDELEGLNADLAERLAGIDDPDERDFIEKAFSDKVAKR